MKYFLFALFLTSALFGYDEPSFSLLESHDCFEIRQYGPMVVAEAHAEGARKEAIKNGFRFLADYILGGNHQNKQIAMTAPVMELPADPSFSPVLQGKKWKVHFVLPENYSLETAPQPKSDQISLIAIPARKIAIVRFSGRTGDDNVIPQIEKLNKFLLSKKLSARGPLVFAYYNPPWTLPFLRRNEIMVEIQ